MNNHVIEREMSITHSEFLRLLPKALNGLPFRQVNNKIFTQNGSMLLTITLADESVRTIASLQLPLTHVQIQLEGLNDEERNKFLKRFDLAYQRGGG